MRNTALRALGAAMAIIVMCGVAAATHPAGKAPHGAVVRHKITAPPLAAKPAPVPTALAMLEPGQWELRAKGEDAPVKLLCVSDLRQLMQVRHDQPLCGSMTINDGADGATVSYDCRAGGNGRTDLRIETARLVQIRTQGIVDGAPFATDYEGRRIGACAS